MKTYMAKKEDIVREWRIVDGSNMPLGRLASQVAAILRGKDKVTFTPNVDAGDHVIIINCKDVVLTGNKLETKIYRHHSKFPGGMKEEKYRILMDRRPEFAVYQAVKGMLPKNAIGKTMLTRLRVFADANHKHEAQQPKIVLLKGGIRE